MLARNMKLVGMLGALFAVSGCATTSGPERLAYYKVPCNTPGAVVAEPVVTDDAAGAPASAAPAADAPRTCVVAVSDPRFAYRQGYSGYYGQPYYGRPYYGSVGIGFGFGGHRGHHGGRHGGGHSGGHRGHR